MKKITTDEFLAWITSPDNHEKIWELIDGVIIQKPIAPKINSIIAGYIGTFLNGYVIPAKCGYVTSVTGGYQLTNYDVLMPKVAYISRNRTGGLDGILFDTAPDLAVEVVSPSENEKSTFIKAHRYLLNGTSIVWIVYPDDKMVYVCTLEPNNSMNVLPMDETQTLTGGDVLPNFTLEVAKIFPDEE